jgi:predicted SAM-dependent methyltransferase
MSVAPYADGMSRAAILARLRALVRSQSTRAFRDAVRQVPEQFRLMRRHRAGLRAAARSTDDEELRLHLASGGNAKSGWINIDLFQDADLTLDLRERLPFRDDSVRSIYSEHFFEHLAYPREVSAFLAEVLRVLAPGGTFSVGIPSVELALECYVRGEEWWFDANRAMWHPAWCDTRIHNINYLFRQGGEHKYAYDRETLIKVLEDAGFRDVRERDWTSQLDSEVRRGSLYVDAIKPGPSIMAAPRPRLSQPS